ncbi:MAG: hypothetical protein OIF50_12890 [Flavobacteriaceae bacterium]|nr:hypothetical protein [Flavobacteriaceae bacterium]
MHAPTTFNGIPYAVGKDEQLPFLVDKFGFASMKALVMYHNRYCEENQRIRPHSRLKPNQQLCLPAYHPDKDRNLLLQDAQAKQDPAFGECQKSGRPNFYRLKKQKSFAVHHQLNIRLGDTSEESTTNSQLEVFPVHWEDGIHSIGIEWKHTQAFENPVLDKAALLNDCLYPVVVAMDGFGHYRGLMGYDLWKEEWKKRCNMVRKKFPASYVQNLIENIDEKTQSQAKWESYLLSAGTINTLLFPIYRDFENISHWEHHWYVPEIGTLYFKGPIQQKPKGDLQHIQFEATLVLHSRSAKQLQAFIEKNGHKGDQKWRASLQLEATTSPYDFPCIEKTAHIQVHYGSVWRYEEKINLRLTKNN